MTRLTIVLLAALVSLGGCQLFQAINLAWNITNVTYSSSFTHVTYTATNLGKVDLTGVNLEIGVDMNGDGTYPRSVWTRDVDIRQGQTVVGSADVYTGVSPLGWATVISVDMDNPKD
jgi:hypothetical protein